MNKTREDALKTGETLDKLVKGRSYTGSSRGAGCKGVFEDISCGSSHYKSIKLNDRTSSMEALVERSLATLSLRNTFEATFVKLF
jgi:hypothetical protein